MPNSPDQRGVNQQCIPTSGTRAGLIGRALQARGHWFDPSCAHQVRGSALGGHDIKHDTRTWPTYRALVRVAVDAIAGVPAVLLSVCTPAELAGWPIGAWLLLDCADHERR